MSPVARTLLGTLALLGLMLGATRLHACVDASREAWPVDADVLYVPPPAYLRPMSLGYREAVADLVWIRALIFTGERLGDTDLHAVERYVEAINGLSPRFHRPYLWGAITAIYGGQGKVTREMVEAAQTIYERGLEQHPESHELLYPYGMLLMTQVGSTSGYSEEEKQALAARGAELIRKAAAFGADPLVRRYAATLVSEYAGEQLAVQFLESQLAAAEDEAHRRLLRRKLRGLAGDKRVEQVEAVRREFFEEQERARPYVPDTVYAVIRDER